MITSEAIEAGTILDSVGGTGVSVLSKCGDRTFVQSSTVAIWALRQPELVFLIVLLCVSHRFTRSICHVFSQKKKKETLQVLEWTAFGHEEVGSGEVTFGQRGPGGKAWPWCRRDAAQGAE